MSDTQRILELLEKMATRPVEVHVNLTLSDLDRYRRRKQETQEDVDEEPRRIVPQPVTR